MVASLSSPPPKWHNARIKHRVPLPPPPRDLENHMALYNSPHHMEQPPNRTLFGPHNTQQHYQPAPAPHVTPPEAPPVKKSMSLCIDAIMDAAEAIKVRDARFHAYYGPPSKVKFGKKPKTSKPVPSQEQKELAYKLEHLDNYTTRGLILTMALEERPRCKQSKQAKRPPAIILPKFFWNEYPKLEQLLFDEMPRYYANQFQSKQQQAYNIELVKRMRINAKELGYSFKENFDDKRLRDRIRCFYKTRIQNARKRLHTLKKHVNDSPKHSNILAELLAKTMSGKNPRERSAENEESCEL